MFLLKLSMFVNSFNVDIIVLFGVLGVVIMIIFNIIINGNILNKDGIFIFGDKNIIVIVYVIMVIVEFDKWMVVYNGIVKFVIFFFILLVLFECSDIGIVVVFDIVFKVVK